MREYFPDNVNKDQDGMFENEPRFYFVKYQKATRISNCDSSSFYWSFIPFPRNSHFKSFFYIKVTRFPNFIETVWV